MKTYELLYLTPLQSNDHARIATRERVARVIQDAGGSILTTREFARQRLSYPINRHDAGEYTIVEFTAPGNALVTIRREFRVSADLLRNLITVKSERARVVGAEIASRERAAAARAAERAAAPEGAGAPPEPKPIEDLDQRLEEILGKEMV